MDLKVNTIVTLQVGDRKFTTYLQTLTESSQYFKTAFSGTNTPPTTRHGDYFVDADPDTFGHLLSYMRSKKLPILWSNAHGFDIVKYHSIEQQALDFGLNELSVWIKEKKYLDAVKVEYETTLMEGPENLAVTGEHMVVLKFKKYKRMYRCPRGIAIHEGRKEACGKDCHKARDHGPAEYGDVAVPCAILVKKKVEIQHEA